MTNPKPESLDNVALARPSVLDGVLRVFSSSRDPLTTPRERIRSTIVMTAVAVAVLVALALWIHHERANSVAADYHWDFSVVWQDKALFWKGLLYTLELTGVSLVAGLVLGIFVAMARLSAFAPLRAITHLYVEIFRCTPPLIQLMWVYYAMPIVTGIQLPAFTAVTVALTLNLGAYSGEAFRSGIQAIPQEQLEAADVLGLTTFRRMWHVVIPQAFRTVLPVLVSLGVSLFKDTSLVSTLGVGELMYQGEGLASATYRPLEIYTTVALIYFVIAFPATILMRRLETRLRRHLRSRA